MKKMMMWALIALVCTTGFISSAGTFPTYAIRNKDTLHSYALEQSRGAYVGAYSDSILPGGDNSKWLSADNYTLLPGAIASNSLVYEVANPHDTIWMSVAYYNESGWATLFGGNAFQLAQNEDGTWSVPPGMSSVQIGLGAYVPIMVEGLSSVMLLERDEYGNVVNYHYPDVYDGNTLYFPTDLAGITGEVFVTFYDSGGVRTEIYDIQTGEEIEGVEVKTTVQVSDKDLEIVPRDRLWVISEPVSTDGVGTSKLVQFEKSRSGGKFYAYARTTEGEVAVGCWVRKMGEENWTRYSIQPGLYAVIPTDAGIYHLYWEWEYFHEPEGDYYGKE